MKMIKIMNKLYQGKENYKKRNAVYRKVRGITEGIKFVGKSIVIIGLFIPTIVGIFSVVVGA